MHRRVLRAPLGMRLGALPRYRATAGPSTNGWHVTQTYAVRARCVKRWTAPPHDRQVRRTYTWTLSARGTRTRGTASARPCVVTMRFSSTPRRKSPISSDHMASAALRESARAGVDGWILTAVGGSSASAISYKEVPRRLAGSVVRTANPATTSFSLTSGALLFVVAFGGGPFAGFVGFVSGGGKFSAEHVRGFKQLR